MHLKLSEKCEFMIHKKNYIFYLLIIYMCVCVLGLDKLVDIRKSMKIYGFFSTVTVSFFSS